MDNKKDKCDKYESFFVFQDEETFNKHIMQCKDCEEEHKKYMKISSMVKEIAPLYLEREKKKKMMTSARRLACCLLVFIGLSAFTGYKVYDNYAYQNISEENSYISEMGLPVDEYGFLSL